MRKNRNFKFFAALLLTALLLFGSWGLYSLRYRGSDIYPFYSSFRADRMGVKALYKSLQAFPELKVGRNLRPLDEIKESKDLCLFVLGCPPWLFDNNFDKIENCALTGARVVVSFTPCFNENSPHGFQIKPQKKKPKIKAAKENLLKESKSGVTGLAVKSLERPIKLPGKAVPVKPLPLPAFKVFSRNCFELKRKGWKILYKLRGEPLMLEKKYKSGGSIIFCADSYLFSNESLADENNAALLLFLMDGKHRVLFDETHLGAMKNRNIAWLARKYNLIPFLLAFGATLLLFIWRNILAPYNNPKREEEESIAEDFSGSSLVNMLRANYPLKDLIGECWSEFRNSRPGKMLSKNKYRSLENIVTAKGRTVDIYNSAVNEYKKREGLRND